MRRKRWLSVFSPETPSVNAGDTLQLAPVPEQIYPYELADALLGAVKALNSSAVESCTQDFFNALRSYHIDQTLSFILQLSSSLQRLESGSYMDPPGGWDYKTLEGSTLADIQEEMIRRCRNDIEAACKDQRSILRKEGTDRTDHSAGGRKYL